MDLLEIFSEDRESIDINPLLKEIELPVRLQNILKTMSFYSEESFYQKVEELMIKHTSRYLMPGELLSFYPQVKERCASTRLTCNLSGANIRKGSFYYTYHPFLENLKTGRVYTIHKKICTELCYIDSFPQDLFTYEEWYYRLKNAYYENNDSEIDFYFFSRECGENCLDVYPLGESKKKRKK